MTIQAGVRKQILEEAIELVKENSDYLIHLRNRWQDEKESTDFDDYIKEIKEKFPGYNLHKFKKSPFSFVIKFDDPKIYIICVKIIGQRMYIRIKRIDHYTL